MKPSPHHPSGAVAAGHELTADAAADMLRAGGNAFDAALAALCAACVAEPVLCSLGGGGFMLARTAAGETTVFDFFTHTPRRRRPEDELDFFPIHADFGTARQEFHIGLGAIATPGVVRGLFDIHRRLGSMPMTEIVTPAVEHARRGVVLNALQAYIFRVVAPIYTATPEALAIYGGGRGDGQPAGEGDRVVQPQLADTLEALAREGDDLFYRGEIAAEIDRACRQGGGHLGRDDLEHYRVAHRAPLHLDYRGARFATNAPPASGGLLIGFALRLLDQAPPGKWSFGSRQHLTLLAEVMDQTNRARVEARLDAGVEAGAPRLLDPALLERYRRHVRGRAGALRGTTHISVMDRHGNLASLTLSNGEGCGRMLPGTGVMLNNMLGEEDINPGGFHRWTPGQRMTSMMSPSMLQWPDGRTVALGSGGSNRIRSAILQVVSNLADFGMEVEDAVQAPRIHFEGGRLSVEDLFGGNVVRALAAAHADTHVWEERNLFFGGVHAVEFDGRCFRGAGDGRRGGVWRVV